MPHKLERLTREDAGVGEDRTAGGLGGLFTALALNNYTKWGGSAGGDGPKKHKKGRRKVGVVWLRVPIGIGMF